MNIAALSGGIMSFYSAYAAIEKYGKENVLLYFNDTMWEHKDLYRFLHDIEKYLGKHISYDNDGRDPEEVFFDNHFLGNNRVPLCSRILKAERLQKYYKDGDNLIFGIGLEEQHRARRIVAAYQIIATKAKKFCSIEFPIIDRKVPREGIDLWFGKTGIKKPELYALGFEHNNCSGGCVRQGKKQWRHLLAVLPDVYKEREELEQRFRNRFGKGMFLKDMTLKELREVKELENKEDMFTGECVGVCQFIA